MMLTCQHLASSMFLAMTGHAQRLQVRDVQAARIVESFEGFNVVDFLSESRDVVTLALSTQHMFRLGKEPRTQPQPLLVIPALLS